MKVGLLMPAAFGLKHERMSLNKKVALATLGCKVSQYETEAIAEAFEAIGFSVVPFDTSADVYVINTCTVTADADRKSRQMIRRAYKRNPLALVMVTGCYAQSSPKELAEIPFVSYIAGNESKMQIPRRASELLERRSAMQMPLQECFQITDAVFEPMQITRAPRTRAYVKIEDGCECRCSYCAIPRARGNVRSKKPADVLREVEALAKGGTREVVLTGIETASYGIDLHDIRLTDLLEQLDREAFVPRLRLGSMTPEFFKPDIIERLSRLKTLTPHMHLSVQSGSSDVLRLMRRRYLAEQAISAVHSLRRAIPDIELTADFIVGFPGESDAHFEETLCFAEEAEFLNLHVFAYSKRQNTPAAALPNQVDEQVKKERSHRLIALGESLRTKRLAHILENTPTVSVLFEERNDGFFVGHTPAFVPVAVKSDAELHGEIADVRPIHHDGVHLFGEIIKIK